MAMGITEKVSFMLDRAKQGNCSEKDLQTIISFANLFSDDMILGRVFGYSIGAYAIATLKWINRANTLKAFKELYNNLTKQQKLEVDELIQRELYLQY